MTIENISIGRYVTISTSRIPWAYCCRGYIVGGDKVAGTIQVFIEKDHDCEFYTFFVEEVDLAMEEPLYAPVEDCMRSMAPADLSSIKHLRPSARRPLSSLTKEEIDQCAIILNDDVRHWEDVEYRAFGKSRCIYSGYTVVRLVRYLDKLGIELG